MPAFKVQSLSNQVHDHAERRRISSTRRETLVDSTQQSQSFVSRLVHNLGRESGCGQKSSTTRFEPFDWIRVHMLEGARSEFVSFEVFDQVW